MVPLLPGQVPPADSSAVLRSQAAGLLLRLKDLKTQASLDLIWHTRFWNKVAAVEDLAPALQAFMKGHGFIGAKPVRAPRAEAVMGELKSFAGVGCPKRAAAAALCDEAVEDSNCVAAPSSSQEEVLNFNLWHSRLASSFPRAVPDIYRKIRSSGAASVRSFITEFFSMEKRSGPIFQQRFETLLKLIASSRSASRSRSCWKCWALMMV